MLHHILQYYGWSYVTAVTVRREDDPSRLHRDDRAEDGSSGAWTTTT